MNFNQLSFLTDENISGELSHYLKNVSLHTSLPWEDLPSREGLNGIELMAGGAISLGFCCH